MSDDLEPDVLVCVHCEAPHGEIHSALCAVRWGRPRLYKPKGAPSPASLTEAERLTWARLVRAERALRAQETQDEGGMATHAAREEVDCAEHDLRRVVLDLGRYFHA